MTRFAVLLGLGIALVWSFSSALQGQELQEGTWSGTWVRMDRNNNPQGQGVSLEVKKVTDPHWRWRPGGGELLSVTFVVPQGRSQVSGLRLESGTLSYSFRRPVDDQTTECRLALRTDGTYEGDCVGPQRFHVTLTPPETGR